MRHEEILNQPSARVAPFPDHVTAWHRQRVHDAGVSHLSVRLRMHGGVNRTR
jgi:hypothetical protein